jgi:steroid delta-isomerase-like uncharacterized protein
MGGDVMNRFALLALLIALVVAAFSGAGSLSAARQEASPVSADCPATTSAENEALIARWYEEAINGHDVTVLNEILAPDIAHESGAFPEQPGVRVIMEALFTGFPDIQETMDEVISTGDTVVVRWTATGTHTGEFQGYAPTGKTATWTGINIFEIECGRIARVVTELDALSRLEQLGLVSEAAATPTR